MSKDAYTHTSCTLLGSSKKKKKKKGSNLKTEEWVIRPPRKYQGKSTTKQENTETIQMFLKRSQQKGRRFKINKWLNYY